MNRRNISRTIDTTYAETIIKNPLEYHQESIKVVKKYIENLYQRNESSEHFLLPDFHRQLPYEAN